MAGYVIQNVLGTAVTATGTVTLPASTRAGNSLIAVASIRNAGTANAALSTVTLGGAADNFGQVFTCGGASQAGSLYWWFDPLCAGGQTQVIFTTTGGAGAEALTMGVMEVGGLLPLAPTVAVDQDSAGTASTASWNSGTAGLTNWTTEFAVGAVVAAGTRSVSGAAIPWVNLTLPADPAVIGAAPLGQPNGTTSITQIGYQSLPGTATPSYSGTFAASLASVAGVVTFPAVTASPSLPAFVAGSGLQQGDMSTLVSAPLTFIQERVMFRAAQTFTTTTLPSGSRGALTTIAYDTVYEDPYQGWDPVRFRWTAPITGWYHCTAQAASGGGGATTDTFFVTIGEFSGGSQATAGLPTNVGNANNCASRYLLMIGGVDFVFVQASISSAGSTTTSSVLPSTFEITWVAGASVAT